MFLKEENIADPSGGTAPPERTFTWLDLGLLGTAVIWGANTVIIKFSLRRMHPLAFNTLRFLFASLLLLVVLRVKEGWPHIEPEDKWKFIGLGISGHMLYQIFFINGINSSTAGNTALILATIPISVAIIGAVAGIENLDRPTWAGIVLSFAGIAMVVLGSGDPISLHDGKTVGDLITLVGTLCWSLYIVYSRPMIEKYSPIVVTAYTMVVGTVGLGCFSLPTLLRQDWGQIPLKSWAGLTYSFFLALVVGYILWSYGVREIGGTRTSLYANLTPVVSIVLGWLFLQEQWTAVQMVGSGLVLCGVSLARLPIKKLWGSREQCEVLKED